MNNVKKLIKPVAILVASSVLYLIILTVLHYFGVMKLASIGSVNFVVMAIVTFIAGIFLGKKTSKKGYLEGLKLGSIVVISMFLVNVIFYRHIDLYVFLYYLVLITSPTIGSMIGINLKH